MDQQQAPAAFGGDVRAPGCRAALERGTEELDRVDRPALAVVLGQVHLPVAVGREAAPGRDGDHVGVAVGLAVHAQPDIAHAGAQGRRREADDVGLGLDLEAHMRRAFVQRQRRGQAHRGANVLAKRVHGGVAGQLAHHHHRHALGARVVQQLHERRVSWKLPRLNQVTTPA
jgi:hypothetical protein